MTKTEYLVAWLAEECAEVIHRCMKGLRFTLAEVQPGQPHDNARRIAEEVNDLQGVLAVLRREGVIPTPKEDPVVKADARLARFLAYAVEVGAVTPDPVPTLAGPVEIWLPPERQGAFHYPDGSGIVRTPWKRYKAWWKEPSSTTPTGKCWLTGFNDRTQGSDEEVYHFNTAEEAARALAEAGQGPAGPKP